MRKDKFFLRKKRTRAKILASKKYPRLSVFRSNKFLYAQVIDDTKGHTLVAVSSADKKIANEKLTKSEKAGLVGEVLAKEALAAKIKKVIFDRGGYKYHGLIKRLADGARKGGLKF